MRRAFRNNRVCISRMIFYYWLWIVDDRQHDDRSLVRSMTVQSCMGWRKQYVHWSPSVQQVRVSANAFSWLLARIHCSNVDEDMRQYIRLHHRKQTPDARFSLFFLSTWFAFVSLLTVQFGMEMQHESHSSIECAWFWRQNARLKQPLNRIRKKKKMRSFICVRCHPNVLCVLDVAMLRMRSCMQSTSNAYSDDRFNCKLFSRYCRIWTNLFFVRVLIDRTGRKVLVN